MIDSPRIVKGLANAIAPTMKAAGYRKRGKNFNRTLANGLIHEVSLYQLGAWSSLHGEFRLEFGCFVPEAELYRMNKPPESWKANYYCSIRGFLPGNSTWAISTSPKTVERVSQAVSDALNVLDTLSDKTTLVANGLSRTELLFDTPPDILSACLLYADGEKQDALKIVNGRIADETISSGHRDHIAEWRDTISW